MNKTTIILPLVIALIATSCHKEEKVIETNERGVPMSVASMILGDNYEIDTLYKSADKAYIYIDNPECTQHIIYVGEEVIANSPTLDIDSLSPSLYTVSDFMRSVRVNFSNPQSIDALRETFPQYPDFQTVTECDTTTSGQKAVFAMVVNTPTDKLSDHQAILKWVEQCIDDTLAFNENMRVFGKEMEKIFFDEWDGEETDMTYLNSRSVLVYEVTPKYITYNDYFYGFMGGAHGMTCNRLVTYLTDEHKPLTPEVLFTADSEDAVRELIYEALAADEDFMALHKITSLSQARTYVQRYLDGDPLPIPAPALVKEGVVFCYQPYDIGPYSDGLHTLVVPYSKIAPYLNENFGARP